MGRSAWPGDSAHLLHRRLSDGTRGFPLRVGLRQTLPNEAEAQTQQGYSEPDVGWVVVGAHAPHPSNPPLSGKRELNFPFSALF
ncbi:hypothetical protein D3C85_1553300 [compost metagenome]